MATAWTVPSTQYAVTGAGTFSPNANDCIPKRTACTGTISAAAGSFVVIGVGTLFTTELAPGMFIYSITTQQLLKIAAINTNTILYLEGTAAVMAGETFGKTQPAFRHVEIQNTGAANGLVNGAVIEPAQIIPLVPNLVSGEKGALDPITYSTVGAATTLAITTI